MTLDGRVAALSGDSRWVSGGAARILVHHWRDQFDAIAVGSGTVLADDPELTTRGLPAGRHPRPVIFDRRGRIPGTARALRPGAVIITGPDTDARHLEREDLHLLRAGDLSQALSGLGELGITSLLLEGGATLAGALLAAELIDEVRVFVAPRLLGAGLSPLAAPAPTHMSQAQNLTDVTFAPVGADVLMQGLLHAVPQFSRPSLTAASFKGA
ncbi:RibD family protein [Deinococcus sp. QL22]|uniref:RibD family protein n=1 Tax=Deinococcus sp. QL22 TaxID=2939437 RepID=UPI00352FF5AE